MSLKTIIGLEIHLELLTETKMFCRCPADHFGKPPNSQTCPTCLGLPGALPYPNQKAIEYTIRLGKALNCNIPLKAKFDRKNYFYPDLPKGYQISQYDQPFCQGGYLLLHINGREKKININRVHLEEDTGRLVHQKINGVPYSLIDFNRSGVPLVEIVSEPEISSIEELDQYARKVRLIAQYLEISPADMEKGQMRFELNISLGPVNSNKLPPYRVEVKNINSFRFLLRSAEYEIKRQEKMIKSGKLPLQETRGYSEKKQATFSQRGKEQAHDYRYFPEPDIPPFCWTEKQIKKILTSLPELPDEKARRFLDEYSLNEKTVEILISKPAIADYFEKASKLAKNKIKPDKIANLIINKKISFTDKKPEQLINEILETKTQSLLNQTQIEVLVEKVIKENPLEVKRFQQGKAGLVDFFVGQVMKLSKGGADPSETKEIVVEKLKK